MHCSPGAESVRGGACMIEPGLWWPCGPAHPARSSPGHLCLPQSMFPMVLDWCLNLFCVCVSLSVSVSVSVAIPYLSIRCVFIFSLDGFNP